MTAAMRNQKGSILVTALVFSFVLLTVTGSYFNLLLSEKRTVLAARHELRSEALAEAGMEEALWEYRSNSMDFDPADGWAEIGTDQIKSENDFEDAFGNDIGSYDVTITNWNTSTPGISVDGTVDAEWDGASAESTVAASLTSPPGLCNAAIEGDRTIGFDQSVKTNSYNSTTGAYGGANILNGGDVYTNGASAGVIRLDLNAQIAGNANTGAGGTVTAPAQVTGSVAATYSNARVPVETMFESDITALDALGDLGTLSSGTTISDDRHYTRMALGAGQTLTINGNVKLYFDHSDSNGTNYAMLAGRDFKLRVNTGGSVQIFTNGKIHFDQTSVISDAANSTLSTGTQGLNVDAVKIYGTSSCNLVDFDKNAIFVGTIYAPNANYQVDQGSSIYGAIVGGSDIQFDQSCNIRFDENLLTSAGAGDKELNWVRRID